MESAEQQYWLSSHVHVCVTDDYAVLLDLRRDKYLGIGREHMATLAAAIVGWPATPRSNLGATTSSKGVLQNMLSTGMLTGDPAIGKEARPPVITCARLAATEADLEFRPRIALRTVSQLLIAAAKARALLKSRPIETVVARVERRKEQACSEHEFDLEAARPIVEQFLYLRPLVFTSQDECLFDSLVLVELLALNHLFPDWLFGVSTSPFKAHSWVQACDCVLNDLPERISGFTPILVV